MINKSNELWFSKFEIINPIKKDPNKFTNKVPNGKLGKKELKINDVKYRNIDPIAPPRAIYATLIKILKVYMFSSSEGFFSITGPLSIPFALSSLSTSSIIAVGALSPIRFPNLTMRV